MVWKLHCVILVLFLFGSCVRTIVVWKRAGKGQKDSRQVQLRENHSGMETLYVLDTTLNCLLLRENHSGMETETKKGGMYMMLIVA